MGITSTPKHSWWKNAMRRFTPIRVTAIAAVVLLLIVVGSSNWPAAQEGRVSDLGKLPVMRLPGDGFRGELPPLTVEQEALAKRLRQSVEHLATEIGERNVLTFEKLERTANWLNQVLTDAGWDVERQLYDVDGKSCQNLIVERHGITKPDEIVIIGAHYDSAISAPGANDNGSGTAALLEFAQRFVKLEPERTLRLVFFTNEEPPHFQTDVMGSMVYARRCKAQKENITAVLSLETIGYYRDEPKSQKYPPPLGAIFPDQGNFIGFVADVNSGPLVNQVLSSFRNHAQFPSEATSLPDKIQGVGWSDQWSFWKFGYPGVMITDTAPFRYPHYHRRTDTPDKLNYERMARVVQGLEKVIVDLVTFADE